MKTIAGKWQIVGFDLVLWEFIEMRRDEKKSEGILVEWHGNRIVDQTTYLWYPVENELVIDRSDLEPDGFVWTCYEVRYRVERVDGETLKISSLRV